MVALSRVDPDALGRAAERQSPRNAAAVPELTSDDLRDMDSAASRFKVEGARYSERLEKMTGL